MKSRRIETFKSGWPFELGCGEIETIGGSKGSIKSDHCLHWIKVFNKVLDTIPDIKIVNDIGCGDMWWVKHTDIKKYDVNYLGYDLVCRYKSQTPFFKIFPKSVDFCESSDRLLIRSCDLTVIKDTICIMETKGVQELLMDLISKTKYLLIEDYEEVSNNDKVNKEISKDIFTKYNLSLHPFLFKPFLVKRFQRGNLKSTISLYKFK